MDSHSLHTFSNKGVNLDVWVKRNGGTPSRHGRPRRGRASPARETLQPHGDARAAEGAALLVTVAGGSLAAPQLGVGGGLTRGQALFAQRSSTVSGSSTGSPRPRTGGHRGPRPACARTCHETTPLRDSWRAEDSPWPEHVSPAGTVTPESA